MDKVNYIKNLGKIRIITKNYDQESLSKIINNTARETLNNIYEVKNKSS